MIKKTLQISERQFFFAGGCLDMSPRDCRSNKSSVVSKVGHDPEVLPEGALPC